MLNIDTNIYIVLLITSCACLLVDVSSRSLPKLEGRDACGDPGSSWASCLSRDNAEILINFTNSLPPGKNTYLNVPNLTQF